ncbi:MULTISPECIES: hypothetical protein [unclassified Streptomyces]|uniref:hypothetical protein n=1 Tax=unclassified Streptomyces TaxID=2593676 RepID=UPI0038245C60
MKATWRRKEDHTPPAEEPAVADTGWATASMSTGAMANWTAVVRWSAWALLPTGPLLGGLGG